MSQVSIAILKERLKTHQLATFSKKGTLESWDNVLIEADTFFTLSGREIHRGDDITFLESDLPLCLSKLDTLHGWLIPKPCHNVSLAKILTIDSWTKIRKKFLSLTHNACVGCGKRDTTLDAHEVWDFPLITNNLDVTKLQPQTLVVILPVCEDCHAAAHANKVWGLVENYTKIDRALKNEELFVAPLKHLQQINLWEDQIIFTYQKFLWNYWYQTSTLDFFLNCDFINQFFPDLVLEVREDWHLEGVMLYKTNGKKTKTVLTGVKWKLENEPQIHFFKERK